MIRFLLALILAFGQIQLPCMVSVADAAQMGASFASIPDGSVTTAKLANGSVTTPKLHVDALYPFYPNGTTADFIGSVKSLGSFRLSQTWNLITEDGVDLAIHGDNAIKFKTANTIDRMIIEAGGNVGIGTASPASQLEVAGNTALDNVNTSLFLNNSAGTSNGITIADNTSKVAIELATGGDILFYTDDEATGSAFQSADLKMTIKESGNVGIGTASPDTLLTLAKDGVISTAGTDGNDTGQIAISGGGALGSVRGAAITLAGNEDAKTGNLDLAAGNVTDGEITFDTGGTQRMVLDDAGQLGIGTASPENLLHIAKSGATPLLLIEQTADDFTNDPALVLKSNYDGGSGQASLGRIGFTAVNSVAATFSIAQIEANGTDYTDGTEGGELLFRVAKDGVLTEAMRIDDEARVGIGTVSPGATLDVNGDARISTSLRISSGPTAGIDILGITGGSTNNDWGATAAQSCDVFVMTIAGVGTNGRWQCNVSASQTTVEDSTCFLRARPSAENTVQVKRCNVGSVSCSDPANATHYINCLNF